MDQILFRFVDNASTCFRFGCSTWPAISVHGIRTSHGLIEVMTQGSLGVFAHLAKMCRINFKSFRTDLSNLNGRLGCRLKPCSA